MGRIKPRFVKNVARYLVANYFDILRDIWDKAEEIKQIVADPHKAGYFRFNAYKKIVSEFTNISSKKIRNKVAGAIVRLMKQIVVLERVSLEELRAKYQLRSEIIENYEEKSGEGREEVGK